LTPVAFDASDLCTTTFHVKLEGRDSSAFCLKSFASFWFPLYFPTYLNIDNSYIIYADLLMTGQDLQSPGVGLVFGPARLTGRVYFSPPIHP